MKFISKIATCTCASFLISTGAAAGITQLVQTSLKTPATPSVPVLDRITIGSALGIEGGTSVDTAYDLTTNMNVQFTSSQWTSGDKVQLIRSGINIYETSQTTGNTNNENWYVNETVVTNITAVTNSYITALVKPVEWSAHYVAYDSSVDGSGFYVKVLITTSSLRAISSDIKVNSMGLNTATPFFAQTIEQMNAGLFLRGVAIWANGTLGNNRNLNINQITLTNAQVTGAVWDATYKDGDSSGSKYKTTDIGAYKVTLTAATDSNVYVAGSTVDVYFRCLRTDMTFSIGYTTLFPTLPTGKEWTAALYIANGGTMTNFDKIFNGATLDLIADPGDTGNWGIHINGCATIDNNANGKIDGNTYRTINFTQKINLADAGHFNGLTPSSNLVFVQFPIASDVQLYLAAAGSPYATAAADISWSFFQISNIVTTDSTSSPKKGNCRLRFTTYAANDFYTAFGQTTGTDDYTLYITIPFTYEVAA